MLTEKMCLHLITLTDDPATKVELEHEAARAAKREKEQAAEATRCTAKYENAWAQIQPIITTAFHTEAWRPSEAFNLFADQGIYCPLTQGQFFYALSNYWADKLTYEKRGKNSYYRLKEEAV